MSSRKDHYLSGNHRLAGYESSCKAACTSGLLLAVGNALLVEPFATAANLSGHYSTRAREERRVADSGS